MTAITVSEIAKGVFQTQLNAMRANLEGCVEGQDPIHLHDLRVANRRTRVALNEFKKLLPDDVLERYQKDFRWIHGETGEVRDLDVNLKQFSRYRKEIPKRWRPCLEPIRELLDKKRISAQKELAVVLQGERIHHIYASWSDLLDQGVLKGSSIALEPAREYGSLQIIKRYQKTRKKGGKLSKKTPPEAFHKYRINIKKLRYLMEFYRPAIEGDEYKDLRKGLKKIQDALGAYQDNVVQISRLRTLAGELYAAGTDVNTILTMGQLLFALEKKSRKNKKRSLKQIRWIKEDATTRAFQVFFQYPVDR